MQIISLCFSIFCELIDLQGPMKFFRSCRYNTGPISKTKNSLEHAFETCVFKGMNFCLREKSFKSFSNEYILFSLFVWVSQFFEMILFVFWLTLFNWSVGHVEYIQVFHSIFWIVFQDLSCYVFLLRRIKNVSLYLILPLFQHFAWCLFDFSRLVSLFSHSAKSDFEHQLLSKAIQNEQSQYKKLKSEVETG